MLKFECLLRHSFGLMLRTIKCEWCGRMRAHRDAWTVGLREKNSAGAHIGGHLLYFHSKACRRLWLAPWPEVANSQEPCVDITVVTEVVAEE